MSIRHAVLGLLSEGPRHGYELRAAYENELVPRSKLNAGQVYTTLERLGRQGLIRTREVGQAGRPDKKVHALTDSGRRELERWMTASTPVDPDLRNQIFIKLMLAIRLPGRDPRTVIEDERRSAKRRLREVAEAVRRAEADQAPLSITLLLDLAALKLESVVHWLDRCERRLQPAD